MTMTRNKPKISQLPVYSPDWGTLPATVLRTLLFHNPHLMFVCRSYRRVSNNPFLIDFALERYGLRMTVRRCLERMCVCQRQHTENTIIEILQRAHNQSEVKSFLINEIYVRCTRENMFRAVAWLKTMYPIPENVKADVSTNNLTYNVSDIVKDALADIRTFHQVMQTGLRTNEVLHYAARHNLVHLLHILIEEYGAWNFEHMFRMGSDEVKRFTVLTDPTVCKLPGFDKYFLLRSNFIRHTSHVLGVLKAIAEQGLHIDYLDCLLLACMQGATELCEHFVHKCTPNVFDLLSVMCPSPAMVHWTQQHFENVHCGMILMNFVQRGDNPTYDVACVYICNNYDVQGVDWNGVLSHVAPKKCFKLLLAHICEHYSKYVDPDNALRTAFQLSNNIKTCMRVVDQYHGNCDEYELADMCLRYSNSRVAKILIKKCYVSQSTMIGGIIRHNAGKCAVSLAAYNCISLPLLWDRALQASACTPEFAQALVDVGYPASNGRGKLDAHIHLAQEKGNTMLHNCLLRMRLSAK